MARWRLTEECYLKTDPPTEWEHKETDQVTGKQRRKVYDVPMYLEKETIVSNGNDAHKDDIVFLGPPTPAMQPLDDEAEALSAAESPKWIHPIESLPATGAILPSYDVPPPQPAQRPSPNIRRR